MFYILKRRLNNDIRTYDRITIANSSPKAAVLLSALIGTGSQIALTFFIVMMLIYFGAIEQSFRGILLKIIILCYNFTGIVGGYYSARIYKMFEVPLRVLPYLLLLGS